jgi:hypothetical protein
MKVQEYISHINPAIFKEARSLIKSKDFMSLKDFGDCYEGFTAYEGGVLFPEVKADKDGEVQKYSCSCRDNNTLCVHIAAMMLGMEKMKQAGCADYHEAVKQLAAQ